MTQWGSDSNPGGEQPAQPDPWAAPPAGGTPPPPAQPDPWAAPPAATPPAATPPPPPAYGAPGAPQYGAPPAYGTPPPPPPPGYGQPPMYGQPPAYGGYPPAPGFVPGPPAMQGMTPFGPPATMGNRFLAYLIDFALVIGVFIVIGILGAILGDAITTLLSLLGYVAIIAYFIYYIGVKQATIGKQMMGIKVVDSSTGGPIGMGRAFLRQFIQGLCFIVSLSPFFDNTKRLQGWHDKIANDFVVSTK